MQSLFGFLNINKPIGCTSHDVISLLRKSLSIKKIGHSGTLDPFASGVLTVGVGDATRLFEYLPSEKEYLAKIKFGVATDTDDITGSIIKTSEIIPDISEISEKIHSFIGKLKQKPPIFSSVKINGNRAYALARKGNLALQEITEKIVEIYSVKVLSYINGELELNIHSSGGTYIRSFARDFGEALNTCALLSYLKRIRANSSFSIENSISPEEINLANLSQHLVNPSLVIPLKKILINDEQKSQIGFGKYLRMDIVGQMLHNSEKIMLIDNNSNVIAVGVVEKDCIIKPEKVFNY